MRRMVPPMLIVLAVPWPAAAPASPRFAWVTPGQARVVRWAEVSPETRDVDPEAPIDVEPGELLLVPVNPGSPIEVRGGARWTGLGAGGDELPEMVTWSSVPHTGREVLRVPDRWDMRLLAVRPRGQGPVRVRVRIGAEIVPTPMDWYRLDEHVAAWAGGGPLPRSMPGPILGELERERAMLEGSCHAQELRAWTMASWLARSWLVRPLTTPLFRRTTVLEGREARTGDRLTFEAPGADVLRLVLRGTGRAVVRSGDIPVRTVKVGGGSRAVRIVPPSARPRASVDVLEGSLFVDVVSFGARAAALEPHLRDRGTYLQRAARTHSPLLRALVRDQTEGTVLARDALQAAGGQPSNAAGGGTSTAAEPEWRSLAPAPGTTERIHGRTPEPDGSGPGRCAAADRWTVIPRGRMVVDVVTDSHERVEIRSLAADPTQEETVSIDGVPITVHSAAGIPSFVTVAPGRRVFERSSSWPEIVARVGRADEAPCAELRVVERWAVVDGETTFALPARVSAARVVARPVGGRASAVTIEAGAGVIEAWVRPGASRAIDVPLRGLSAPGRIRVRVDRPTLVRVRAPFAAPGSSGPPAGVPPTIDDLLSRVRMGTREIREAAAADRPALHLRRGAALAALGFGRLALADGVVDPAPRVGPEPVLAGWVARVPPLPLPADPGPLRAARRAMASGRRNDAIAALSNRSGSGAEMLLLAIVARDAGRPELAARALEQIGLQRSSPAALSRAAGLWADAAIATGDAGMVVRALVLAERAGADEARDVRARLEPAIRWARASGAQSVAGSALVVEPVSSGATIGDRVRRALVDAPEDAIVLGEDLLAEARIDRRTAAAVEIEGALDRPGPCEATVEVDGARATCPCHDGRLSCSAQIPAGSHRIEVSLGPGRIGWVSIRSDGSAVSPRLLSRWLEIDAARPLELAASGPTVLRVRARSDADEERALLVSVAGGSAETIVVPASPAAGATRRAGGTPLGAPVERGLPVLAAGPATLRILSPRGRVLLHVEAATGAGLPLERIPVAEKAVVVPFEAPGVLRQSLPAVGEDPPAGPLLVRSAVSAVDPALYDSDHDPEVLPHLEASLFVHRALVPERVFAGAGLLGRIRFGAPSFGLSLAIDIASRGLVPGAWADLRALAQPVTSGTALGGRAEAGVFWSVPAVADLRLVPWLSVTGRRADGSAAGETADRDVYSQFAEGHPAEASLGLRVHQRLAADLVLRYGLSTRSRPGFDGIDRVDARVEADLLAGRGLSPWIALGWLGSARPRTSERDEAFFRTVMEPRVTFWTWQVGSNRVLLSAELAFSLDFPTAHTELSAGATLGWDLAFRRGLGDLPPQDRVFRDRLEEGARLSRARPARDPRWDEP